MIKLKNIRKEWEKNDETLTAIENVSLSIKCGEIVSIIGPSGCGKTTLLRLIAGLITPTSGKINIENRNIRKKNNLSIIFQNPSLFPWRTVEENIQLPNEIENIKLKKNVRKSINLVCLNGFEKYYPKELSGGMQQKTALARALVSNPDLLLMDEPFGALDEINRNKMNLELLAVFKKIKPTIIFVTHSIEEAIFLSNRVVVLSKRPAKIKKIIEIAFPYPRKLEIKESQKFQRYIKCIRNQLN